MVAKIPSELSNTTFSPELIIDSIAEVPERKGYTRKAVAYNNRHLGNQVNVTNHQKAGYEIVYSNTETIKDTRAFSPDNHKEVSSVPSAVLKTTSDGVKYVLMEIQTKELYTLKEKESAKNLYNFTKSAKGIKAKKDGSLHIDGGFINDQNPNES